MNEYFKRLKEKVKLKQAFPWGSAVKNPSAKTGEACEFNPWIRKIPFRRTWQSTPIFSPVKSHGQRGLAGYNPQDRKESDTTF